MPQNTKSQYTQIRRKWRDVDTRADLTALWTKERFESASAVEEALRIYEIAIRVEGWETIKGWARELLKKDRILNAQQVELAIRALEQKDAQFLDEITGHLLSRSPPNYFKFWFTLFCTRHAHQGERIFRAQLAELSDYRVVKYRRWLRKILRKLRFRCRTEREKAIGAVVFAMYKTYDPSAYPSKEFSAFLLAHKVANNPEKTKQGKPVSGRKQAENFGRAAASLGIWTVAEGIRTSAQIPRTLSYLSQMAPVMTDQELLKALRAFDGNLMSADHKKAPEAVVQCAEYIKSRLSKMERSIEEWAKIYPYLKSPVLIRVFEDLLEPMFDAAIERLQSGLSSVVIPIVPASFDARPYRSALLLAYLLYRAQPESAAYLLNANGQVQALCHPSSLLPFGRGSHPGFAGWNCRPRKHRVAFELIKRTFPEAAVRQRATPVPIDPLLLALRHHLYVRAIRDQAIGPQDVPLIMWTDPPGPEQLAALRVHLQMFPASILARFEKPWLKPADEAHWLHQQYPCDIATTIGQLCQLQGSLSTHQERFRDQLEARSQEIRELRLAPPLPVSYVPHGPFHR